MKDVDTLTYAIAKTLKKGDILFHNILEFGLMEDEKEPATCIVLGKVKFIGGVEEFELPVRRGYGGKESTVLTKMSKDLWRLSKEKPEVLRPSTPREVPTPATSIDPSSEDDKTPVMRVRRTRTTVTGRIVDDNAVLLQNGQDQLQTLRVRRTR